MNNVPTIDQAIGNAEASIHMEGLRITDEYRELCRRLLKQEISFEDYLAKVKADIQK
jgi:hypothetical protein